MPHHVSLIHCTNDGDSLVAYMARVSNPKGQTKDSTKLIAIGVALYCNDYK